MGIELNFFISGLDSAKAGARFTIQDDVTGVEIVRGTIDIPADGHFQYPMAGQGKLEGEWVDVLIDDFNGSNHAIVMNSRGMNQVKDDGFVPPPLGQEKKVVAFGDSITDFGSSSGVTGRPSNEYLMLEQNGYWCSALNVLATGDYIVLDDLGVSGNTTAQMLARVSDVLVSGADIVLFQAGHNDTSQSVPIQDTKDNIDSILSNLLSANLKVVISLTTHRNRVGENNAALNLNVDAINDHFILRASELNNVDVTAVPTDYNNLIMSNQTDWGDVTMDGLHPNNNGAMIYGAHTITTLELLYPSLINKESDILDGFIGTGGVLSNGATGVTPDGWRGYYANPTGDVGFSNETSMGKNWVIMTTNGDSSPLNNSNLGYMILNPSLPVGAGKWIAEALVIFDSPELMQEFRLELNSTTSTYNYTRFTALKAESFGFVAGTAYKIRTPMTFANADTVAATIHNKQDEGINAKTRITDFKIYKVADL